MALKYKNAKPHIGYEILNKICTQIYNGNYFIFTSNVDRLHQKSGCENSKICEIHGNLLTMQCDFCNTLCQIPENFQFDHTKFECTNLPKCKNCGNLYRPNVFLFQDDNWNREIYAEQEQNFQKFTEQNKNDNLLILEIGAGITIPTIRYFNETQLINPNLLYFDKKACLFL